jgi:hypothetical protein
VSEVTSLIHLSLFTFTARAVKGDSAAWLQEMELQ